MSQFPGYAALRRSAGPGMRSFLSSAVVHLLLLIILGVIVVPPPVRLIQKSFVFSPPIDNPEVVNLIDPFPTPESTSTISDLQSLTTIQEGASLPLIAQLPDILIPSNRFEDPRQIRDSDWREPLSRTTTDASSLERRLRADSQSRPEVADDLNEALTELTKELWLILEAHESVHVVWCLDQSESMLDERSVLLEQIKYAYKQLAEYAPDALARLKTSVTGFGDSLFVQEAAEYQADVQVIAEAIQAVPTDPSGRENVCSAICQICERFDRRRRVNGDFLVLVVLTDEAGERDDRERYLEAAVQTVNSVQGCVYFLTREATFGAYETYANVASIGPYAFMVTRGPETPFVEQFQADLFGWTQPVFSSGYAPFAQARLATMTGGKVYLITDPDVLSSLYHQQGFDKSHLDGYEPELCSVAEYRHQIETSTLRSELMRLVALLDPRVNHSISSLQHYFAYDPQRGLDQTVVEMQKASAGWLMVLRTAEQRIEELEPLRAEESSKRWQANFDLLRAQMIANRIRVEEYKDRLRHVSTYREAQVVARAAARVPVGKRLGLEAYIVRDPISGVVSPEDQARAQQLLQQVVDRHPMTPWALRAAQELQSGLGINLVIKVIPQTRSEDHSKMNRRI